MGRSSLLSEPPSRAFAITPNNSTDLSIKTRGLYVGAAGDVKVDMVGGDTVTFVGMQAGLSYALRVKRVYATGTTATNLLGLY